MLCETFVALYLSDESLDSIDAIEELINADPRVIEGWRLLGDPRFIIRVLCRQAPEIDEILRQFRSHPAIQRTTEFVTSSYVKGPPSIPLSDDGPR